MSKCGDLILIIVWSMRWWWVSLCTRPTRWIGFLLVLAHWNNSPRVDMSLQPVFALSLWFDPTGVRTHELPYIIDAVHSRYDTLTINNTCSLTFTWFPTKILHCDKQSASRHVAPTSLCSFSLVWPDRGSNPRAATHLGEHAYYYSTDTIKIRKDMDLNEHERLSNITLRHKLK
jgi:hypothetical protein